jgi:hypothetical protein
LIFEDALSILIGMNISSNPVSVVRTPDDLAQPFQQAEKQVILVGKMMLPAGQTLTLQANIQIASQMPLPKPIVAETPAVHNVKLLPLVALMPDNGMALGGAILQAIRTLRLEADRKFKDETPEKKKKGKKSLKGIVSRLMESGKERGHEGEQEEESPLKKRRAARASERIKSKRK